MFKDEIWNIWSMGPTVQTLQKNCVCQVLFEGKALKHVVLINYIVEQM